MNKGVEMSKTKKPDLPILNAEAIARSWFGFAKDKDRYKDFDDKLSTSSLIKGSLKK